MLNLTILWIEFLRSVLHTNSLIILVRSSHRSCLRIDGVIAVTRYCYVSLRIGGMHLTISVFMDLSKAFDMIRTTSSSPS